MRVFQQAAGLPKGNSPGAAVIRSTAQEGQKQVEPSKQRRLEHHRVQIHEGTGIVEATHETLFATQKCVDF